MRTGGNGTLYRERDGKCGTFVEWANQSKTETHAHTHITEANVDI